MLQNDPSLAADGQTHVTRTITPRDDSASRRNDQNKLQPEKERKNTVTEEEREKERERLDEASAALSFLPFFTLLIPDIPARPFSFGHIHATLAK